MKYLHISYVTLYHFGYLSVCLSVLEARFHSVAQASLIVNKSNPSASASQHTELIDGSQHINLDFFIPFQ